jgi:hypothetical protein
MSSQLDGNIHVNGTLTMKSIVLPADSVLDASIPAGANVNALKLQHQHRILYAQPYDDCGDERKVLHVVVGATGTIQQFVAGMVAPCIGAAEITVDLLKNGTTILTAPITLDAGDAAYELVAAAVDDDELAQDDVLEISVTLDPAGGTEAGSGLFAALTVNELPQ